MLRALSFRVLAALTVLAAGLGAVSAQTADVFKQGWILDPKLSTVYMQTVKANAIFETHRFNSVEGGINANAEASVKIDLSSINSGVDVRDVRLRFVLFETFKFPFAEVTAKLDPAKLQPLLTTTRIEYPLTLSLNMHGVVREIQTKVWVTRIGDTMVSVATIEPINVTAESLGLAKNILKLSEIINGTPIASAAAISFDLVFGTGNQSALLASARASREAQKAAQDAQPISAEACETRLTVITETGAIYFKTGSAELDRESEPLLKTVTEVASRCPGVEFNVEGHTDNIGDRRANKQLSELRARSVVDDLTRRGITATRVAAAGYGDARPVASNADEAGRARNRRIEFKVRKR